MYLFQAFHEKLDTGKASLPRKLETEYLAILVRKTDSNGGKASLEWINEWDGVLSDPCTSRDKGVRKAKPLLRNGSTPSAVSIWNRHRLFLLGYKVKYYTVLGAIKYFGAVQIKVWPYIASKYLFFVGINFKPSTKIWIRHWQGKPSTKARNGVFSDPCTKKRLKRRQGKPRTN